MQSRVREDGMGGQVPERKKQGASLWRKQVARVRGASRESRRIPSAVVGFMNQEIPLTVNGNL